LLKSFLHLLRKRIISQYLHRDPGHPLTRQYGQPMGLICSCSISEPGGVVGSIPLDGNAIIPMKARTNVGDISYSPSITRQCLENLQHTLICRVRTWLHVIANGPRISWSNFSHDFGKFKAQ
jgi:hypothetical protein